MGQASTTSAETAEENPAAAVRVQILKWAAEQPLWKQEALRRVLQGNYAASDVDELATAVEQTAVDTKSEYKTLENNDFPTSVAASSKFILDQIRDVKNVNRLAPKQEIKFGATGLTAIYGDNGSGKSGYARVFKRACGARDQESILADVFADTPVDPASATFLLKGLSPDPLTIDWKNDGGAAATPLNNVAVFDSRAAPFYVEKSAVLTFVPYGLDCFERLASLLDAISLCLSQRIAKIDESCAHPLVEGNLQAAAEEAFVELLALKYPDLEEHLIWNDDLQKALDAVSHAAADPAGRVAGLRKATENLETFVAGLSIAHQFVSDANIQLATTLRDDAKAAQAAADAGAEQLFADHPLKGVGTEPWRILFNAAKAFSDTTAYPGREFPPHDPGDRCVLCLQELDADAQTRLAQFQSFVMAEISATAAAAAAAFKDFVGSFEEASAAFGKLSLDAATRADASAEAVELDLVRTAILGRFEIIEKTITEEPKATPNPLPDGPWEKCLKRAAALKHAADELQALIDSGNAGQLANQQIALQVRQAFCHSPGPVKLRWQALHRRAELAAAIPSCGTSNVTKRGGDLLRQFVTERLSQRFEAERAALNITNVEVQLTATPKKGGVERNLNLGKQAIKAPAPNVLSEGEYRAAALAAFFAEQSMTAQCAPLVIDDPVSSLDHKRRELVATRLAAEAKFRQVIVFTHDLAFFVTLEAACAANQVPWTRIYLERSSGGYGSVSDQPAPWDAQSFGERKQNLAQRLAELTKHHKDLGENEAYRDKITVFFDRARKTWERGLEELVLNNTVVRYRPSLQTLRLKDVVIDDAVYQAFTDGMTNASKITGHDQAIGLGGGWPDPAAAEALLTELIAFEALVKSKSQQAGKSRKAAAKPTP